jgi:two-component system LytT family sensor kinase
VAGLAQSIDAVGPIPIAYVVLAGAAVLLVSLLVAWLIRRRRKPNTAVADATLDAVHGMARAVSALHGGLNQPAAEQLTSQLRPLLDCLAVGITDREATVLAWDGEAAEHYLDLVTPIDNAIRNQHREYVQHDKMMCRQGSSCRVRTAVMVPVVVEDRTEAVLIVIGRSRGQRITEIAEAVAHFVCTQLEVRKLEEHKRLLQRAEIKAMRAQISPHFVYNALNTISDQIDTDPEEASALLHDFADFTRYCFRSDGYFTTLSEELRNIDRYLTIQSARYGEKLNVRLKIAPEVLSVVVPFLLIQPLVENAVQHGLMNKKGGGTVTVTAQDKGNEAVVSVEDDGVGMDPRVVDKMRDSSSSAHIGLTGINRRLRQVFRNSYGLTVETAPGEGTLVTIRVPKFFPGVAPDLPYARPKDAKQEERVAAAVRQH